jgi:hypothetical protein
MLTPELPSPDAVRAACARRCWDDDTDDVSRVLLEQAADTIRALMLRCGKLSKSLEASEMQTALLRAVAYGPQKGGAA